eukprot:4960201-Prymnesium_polylepis.1
MSRLLCRWGLCLASRRTTATPRSSAPRRSAPCSCRRRQRCREVDWTSRRRPLAQVAPVRYGPSHPA